MKAPDDEPRGVCPRCDGCGSLDPIVFDRCTICDGSGKVPRGRAWTPDDDNYLRSHPAAVIGAAIALRRPVSEIWIRISELGLEREEPSPFMRIKVGTREIDPTDPAGFGGGP